METRRRLAIPATPLSDATVALQTGSFASPPRDGYAFALTMSRTWKITYLQRVTSGRHRGTRELENKVNRSGAAQSCGCDAVAFVYLTYLRPDRKLPRLAWGHSSAGRALAWHARGRRFDPAWLHQIVYSASPSSRGPGHRPFTAVTGVRIPLGTPPCLRRNPHLRERQPAFARPSSLGLCLDFAATCEYDFLALTWHPAWCCCGWPNPQRFLAASRLAFRWLADPRSTRRSTGPQAVGVWRHA